MTFWHWLLHSHTLMSKGDAEIVMCGRRWRRVAEVWYCPGPGGLWEQIDDLDELIARLP